MPFTVSLLPFRWKSALLPLPPAVKVITLSSPIWSELLSWRRSVPFASPMVMLPTMPLKPVLRARMSVPPVMAVPP